MFQVLLKTKFNMKFTFQNYGIKSINITKLFPIPLHRTVHLKILNSKNCVIRVQLKTKLCTNAREKTTLSRTVCTEILSCVKYTDKNVTFKT